MSDTKENWGVFAAEMLMAWMIARTVQEWIIPTGWMLILVPLAWLVVHYSVGKYIEKYLTKEVW